MRTSRRLLPVASAMLVALAGCGEPHPASQSDAAAVPPDWRSVATAGDRARLRSWHGTWVTALTRARRDNAAAIAAQGALFDPDRALAGAVPPPGRYRCRIFKLGAHGAAMREFTAYPAFECVVGAGPVAPFYRLGGGQRAYGNLYRDTDARGVFLGAVAMADERRAMEYGRDSSRDMAGFVERIGLRRWRLVLPAPRFESLLDVVEIVPADR